MFIILDCRGEFVMPDVLGPFKTEDEAARFAHANGLDRDEDKVFIVRPFEPEDWAKVRAAEVRSWTEA